MRGRKLARDASRRITVRGHVDRRAAEAFQLEIRRLARHYGIEIEAVEIKKAKNRD